MPSPLNGLIDAAGVADDQVGRARPGADRKAHRQPPPVAGPRQVSGLISHDAGAYLQKASSIWVVLTPFHWSTW